ncbi:MAG TPA: helix-turn-helix domain-containing protein [Vicinamibacterales bacterium]
MQSPEDVVDRSHAAIHDANVVLEQAARVRRASNFKGWPRILDPDTHPQREVCLAVAADYLGLNERTVRVLIGRHKIKARITGVMGRVYKIDVQSLKAYRQSTEQAA